MCTCRQWQSGLEPPVGEDIVEFRLLYEGKLLGASRNSTRSNHKHDIRCQFHEQLKWLWNTNPALITQSTPQMVLHPGAKERVEVPAFITELAEQYKIGNQGFIPLVTERLFATCSLDILFLRPNTSGMLLQGGDIDNRLKTLFDALRLPKPGELPQGDGVNPLYCLLEDDKLISRISVTTDELLLLPHTDERDPNHVFLQIHVKVKPIQIRSGNMFLA